MSQGELFDAVRAKAFPLNGSGPHSYAEMTPRKPRPEPEARRPKAKPEPTPPPTPPKLQEGEPPTASEADKKAKRTKGLEGYRFACYVPTWTPDGAAAFQVRFETKGPPPDKDFRYCHRPEAGEKLAWKLPPTLGSPDERYGSADLLPFGAPELFKRPEAPVWIVEGAKAMQAGRAAVAAAGEAFKNPPVVVGHPSGSTPPAEHVFESCYAGRKVHYWEDRDKAGLKLRESYRQLAVGRAVSFAVLEPGFLTEIPGKAGGDPSADDGADFEEWWSPYVSKDSLGPEDVADLLEAIPWSSQASAEAFGSDRRERSDPGSAEASSGPGEPWLEPEPFETVSPVPPFDVAGLVPDYLRPLVEDVAARLNVAPELPAHAYLVAASSLCRAVVQVSVRKGYDLGLNLYGVAVAGSGYGKSPATRAALEPFHRFAAEHKHDRDSIARDHRAKAAALTLRIGKLEKAASSSSDTAQEELCKRLEELRDEREAERLKGERPDWFVSDTTPEALQRAAHQNDGGAFQLLDEFSSFLATMKKRGHEQTRGIALRGWSGMETESIRRMGRGPIDVRLALSLYGSIQPAVICAAVAAENSSDGLLQRLQLLSYSAPDALEYAPLSDQDETAVVEALQALERLWCTVEARPDGVLRLPFSSEGLEEFERYRREATDEINGCESQGPEDLYASHVAKLEGCAVKLAGLFHLLSGAKAREIAGEHVARACRWATWLREPARRLYGVADGVVPPKAQAFADLIAAGAVPDGISLRRIYRKHKFAGIRSAPEARKVVEYLQQRRYLRVEVESRPGGGTPTTRVRINPKAVKR